MVECYYTLNLFLVQLWLFSTIIPIISPSFSLLYNKNTGESAIEINVCDLCQSSVKIVCFESRLVTVEIFEKVKQSVWCLLFLHDKLMNGESQMSGTVRAFTPRVHN